MLNFSGVQGKGVSEMTLEIEKNLANMNLDKYDEEDGKLNNWIHKQSQALFRILSNLSLMLTIM